MAAAFIIIHHIIAFLCKYTQGHTHLFDTAGVLLHGYLFHGTLEAEEGLDVQTGRLLETRPVLILRVNLCRHTQNILVTHTNEQRYDGRCGVPTANTLSPLYVSDAEGSGRLVGVGVSVCLP